MRAVPTAFLALLALLASFATPLATPLAAQQRIERGWGLSPEGAVKIHNLNGRIRVVGWDRDSIAVEGTLPAGARFYGGGSRAGVKLGVEDVAPGETSASTLTLRLPRTANVAVRGAATDVVIEGLVGVVDVATVGGELEVAGSPRNLTVETMDGPLTILGSPSLLRARTASGTLRWEGSADDATLSTVGGAVRVRQGPFSRLRIETISGHVSVDGTLATSADVSVETHSGDIEFVLPPSQPVRVSADAARISGAGVSLRTRDERKPGAPHVIDFNVSVEVAVVAHVSVRSFKGQLLIRAR